MICIDLTSVYECVPQLGVLPGDTLLAFYQDPSNHSDSAMISVKVGIGGGGTPPSQQSTTMFVDAGGNEVANYTDADTVYVCVCVCVFEIENSMIISNKQNLKDLNNQTHKQT